MEWRVRITKDGKALFYAPGTLPEVTLNRINLGRKDYWMIRFAGKYIEDENLYGTIHAAMKAAEEHIRQPYIRKTSGRGESK